MPRGPRSGRRGGGGIPSIAAILAIGLVVAGCLTVASIASTQQKAIRGTPKADKLVGTAGKDRMYGYTGADWIRGLGSADVIVGGPGVDTLSGGPGDDQLLARDKGRDKVFCGAGKDRAVVDETDIVFGDCEDVLRPTSPPESRSDCATTNYTTWSWEQCKPGTKIVVTNRSWHCDKPLASYGPLPIKVVSIATAAWVDAGAVTVDSGCTGVPGDDVNLIVDIRGEGPTSSNGAGIDAFKTRVNPENLRITGSIQCGYRVPDAHQDALQIQGGRNITFVNVEGGGDYDAGLSTCQGAGGGPFYSFNQITNVDILGGKWIGCNHALNGGNAGADNDVIDAKFRSGRNDGSDPNCTFASSRPCARTAGLRLKNVVCEEWIGSRWTPVAPR